MKLWEPTTCCCFKLRTGSIIIGVLFLVGGCFSLIGGIQTLYRADDTIEKACEDEPNTEECLILFWNIELGTTITSMVIACFHILFSILLIHGIVKQKTAYFIPLMTIYAVQIGLMILVSVLAIGALLYFGFPAEVGMVVTVILGLAIFLETYFLLVIRAYYYEIKRAKGHIHMTLDEKTGDVPHPHSPPPPYSADEALGYPGSDAPLYPDLEKAAK